MALYELLVTTWAKNGVSTLDPLPYLFPYKFDTVDIDKGLTCFIQSNSQNYKKLVQHDQITQAEYIYFLEGISILGC